MRQLEASNVSIVPVHATGLARSLGRNLVDFDGKTGVSTGTNRKNLAFSMKKT